MKLPWYIKSNGVESIGGSLFLNLKVRRIYVLWVGVKTVFKLIFFTK